MGILIVPGRLAFAGYPDQFHIAASIGFTFFAYEGFRVITNTAEDMPNPSVQLPMAMISTASAINANLYAVTNITYQMARYGELPEAFGRPIRHSREGLLISAAVVAALVPSLDLSSIAVIGSVTILLVHVAVHLGHWRLSNETGASRPLVGLAVLANLAVIVAVVWFEFVNTPARLFYLGGFISLAAVLEFLLRRGGRGAISRRGTNSEGTAP